MNGRTLYESKSALFSFATYKLIILIAFFYKSVGFVRSSAFVTGSPPTESANAGAVVGKRAIAFN